MPEVDHFRRLTGQADRVAIGIGSRVAKRPMTGRRIQEQAGFAN